VNVKINHPRPFARTPAKPKMHCPECGEAFTDDMMGLLDKSERTFCEFCGNQLEYVLQ
jgi:formylmethanofuran dehydrogenase subunit E